MENNKSNKEEEVIFRFYQVFINASNPEITDTSFAGYFSKGTIASPSTTSLGDGSVLLKFRTPLEETKVRRTLEGHINNGYITEIIIK